jgi:hypothetical protein
MIIIYCNGSPLYTDGLDLLLPEKCSTAPLFFRIRVLNLVCVLGQPVIVTIVGRMCSCVVGHIPKGDTIKGSESR